jgi:methionyl-tRNA formyltransferase
MDEKYVMRLVFIGASRFGLLCLEKCLNLDGIDVVGVISAQKEFKISYSRANVNNILHADIQTFSREHGLPVMMLETNMLDHELIETVESWKPDAFLVCGWYHMIPDGWFEMAPAYGLHASLLPDYSGGAPLVWAMINGESKTGITLFKMDSGVDTGPIVGQASTKIYDDDTILSLYRRIEELGLKLLSDKMPLINAGIQRLKPQNNNMRRVMPQRSPEDGLIDWSCDSKYLDRFIRAQTLPYPGAFSFYLQDKVYIWKARVDQKDLLIESGCVIVKNKHTLVACGRGHLILDEISINSKYYYGCEISEIFNRESECFDSNRTKKIINK